MTDQTICTPKEELVRSDRYNADTRRCALCGGLARKGAEEERGLSSASSSASASGYESSWGLLDGEGEASEAREMEEPDLRGMAVDWGSSIFWN